MIQDFTKSLPYRLILDASCSSYARKEVIHPAFAEPHMIYSLKKAEGIQESNDDYHQELNAGRSTEPVGNPP